MTILIDDTVFRWRGKNWCHMVSDSSIDELHTFAKKLGLKRSWFQNKPCRPHYDITANKRRQALEKGAVACTSHELIASQRKLYNSDS